MLSSLSFVLIFGGLASYTAAAALRPRESPQSVRCFNCPAPSTIRPNDPTPNDPPNSYYLYFVDYYSTKQTCGYGRNLGSNLVDIARCSYFPGSGTQTGDSGQDANCPHSIPTTTTTHCTHGDPIECPTTEENGVSLIDTVYEYSGGSPDRIDQLDCYYNTGPLTECQYRVDPANGNPANGNNHANCPANANPTTMRKRTDPLQWKPTAPRTSRDYLNVDLPMVQFGRRSKKQQLSEYGPHHREI